MLRDSKTVFFTLCDEDGKLKQYQKVIELKLRETSLTDYQVLGSQKYIKGKKVLNILEPGYQLSHLYQNHESFKLSFDQMRHNSVEQFLNKFQNFETTQIKEKAIKNYETPQMYVFSRQGKLNDAPFELLKSSEIQIHPDITKFTPLNLLKTLEIYSSSTQREGK